MCALERISRNAVCWGSVDGEALPSRLYGSYNAVSQPARLLSGRCAQHRGVSIAAAPPSQSVAPLLVVI